MSDKREEPVRVVDRRWWARGESADTNTADVARERKPTVVEELEQRLAEAQQQLQAIMVEHRRAADEFEQAKARIRREVGREVERGRRAVIIEMLEVADNLDRAIHAARTANVTDATETLIRGVELVRDQFLAKLESFGVRRVAALGAPFDPQVHEAVSMAPVADPEQAGLVVAVAKEGYAIGDELLRAASVVVGTHA